MSVLINVQHYPHVTISGVSEITAEVMLVVAEQLLGQYKASGAHVDAKTGDGSYTRQVTKPYDARLYELSRIAEKTAALLRNNKRPPVSSIFSFSLVPHALPRRGDKVKVHKGAIVRSTHPSYPRQGKTLAREQTVEVHSVHTGSYNSHHAEDGIGWHPVEITWAGSGGYWMCTNL